MIIKKFSFQDKLHNWTLNSVEFNRDLSLLVGVSGVGKTRIIKALLALKNITKGHSGNGVGWSIEFQAIDGDTYNWTGQFEEKPVQKKTLFADDEDEKEKPNIVSEKITKNETILAKRDKKAIYFQKKETVKLSQKESIISLLKNEEILDIQNAFKRILNSELSHGNDRRGHIYGDAENLEKKHTTIGKIKKADIPVDAKLYLCQKNKLAITQEIKNSFIEIFPQIEDIRVKAINDSPLILEIQIKEKGVNEWIPDERISSGMLRTLVQIAEIYLAPKGTVVLIDEFENSLGINCLDSLTEQLFFNSDIQFIITSHHPYIINNIRMDKWKVVTRKAGKVTVLDAQDLKLGKTKHDAFLQLLNSPLFTEGINIES